MEIGVDSRTEREDKGNTMRKVPVAFTIEPEQLAVVRAFAKDMGYDSPSAAMRRIIDEWQKMKAQQRPRQLVDTQWPYVTEEER